MPREENHSIYLLSDSRTPDLIRYVGRTIDPVSRLEQHRKGVGTSKKDKWIRSVKNSGGDIVMRVIKDGLSLCEVIAAEKTCIKLMFSLGYDLVNTADFSKVKYVAVKVDDALERNARRAATLTMSSGGIDGGASFSHQTPEKKPPRNSLGLKGVVRSGTKYRVRVSFKGGHVNCDESIPCAKTAAMVSDFISYCFYDGDCYLNNGGEFSEEAMKIAFKYMVEASNIDWTSSNIISAIGSEKQKRRMRKEGLAFDLMIHKAISTAKKIMKSA